MQLLYRVNHRVGKLASLSFIEKNYGLHDEYVILVGWGITNQSTEQPSQYLHEAKVNLLSNAVCENHLYAIFQREFLIPDKYLCTQGEPQVLVGGVSILFFLRLISDRRFYHTRMIFLLG